jgi:hypothetical protein
MLPALRGGSTNRAIGASEPLLAKLGDSFMTRHNYHGGALSFILLCGEYIAQKRGTYRQWLPWAVLS